MDEVKTHVIPRESEMLQAEEDGFTKEAQLQFCKLVFSGKHPSKAADMLGLSYQVILARRTTDPVIQNAFDFAEDKELKRVRPKNALEMSNQFSAICWEAGLGHNIAKVIQHYSALPDDDEDKRKFFMKMMESKILNHVFVKRNAAQIALEDQSEDEIDKLPLEEAQAKVMRDARKLQRRIEAAAVTARRKNEHAESIRLADQ